MIIRFTAFNTATSCQLINDRESLQELYPEFC